MKTLQRIALIFTIIGAINWGLVGLFEFNLVDSIFGINSIVSKVIYAFIALCGLINVGLLLDVDEYEKRSIH